MSLTKAELPKLIDEDEEVALDAMTRRVATKLGLYRGTNSSYSNPASMEKLVLLAIKTGYLEGKKDQICRQLEVEKKGKVGQEKVFQDLSAKAEEIMRQKDQLFASLQRLHRVRGQQRLPPSDQNKEVARYGQEMNAEENYPEVTRRYRELAMKVSLKYRWEDIVEVLQLLGKRDWTRVETATAALPQIIQKVARDAVSSQIGGDENMLKVMEEAAGILETKQAAREKPKPPNYGGEVTMRWRNWR